MAKELVHGGASVMTPMDSDVTVFHLTAANNDVRMLDFAIKQK